MSVITRTYTFTDGTTAYGSQVDSEIANIVTTWNNTDAASFAWTSMLVSGTATFNGTVNLNGAVNPKGVTIFNPSGNQQVRLNNATFASAGGLIELARPGDGSYQSIIGVGPDANDDFSINNASGGSFLRLGANSTVAFYIGETNANMMANTRPTSTLLGKITTAGATFKGTNTNDSAAAGYMGEYISSSQSTPTNFAATNNFGNITSISLTAGDWDVSGEMNATLNGATCTQVIVAVSLFSANTTTDHTDGDNVMHQTPPTATNSVSCGVLAWRVSVNATTTVYLKGNAQYSAGNPQYTGRISARRVR